MRRDARWLAVLLAGAAGGLGWRAWVQAPQPAQQVVPQPGGAASAAAAVPSPVVAAAVPAARPPASADKAADICGLGWVSRQEIERWNPAEQARAEQMLQSLDHRKYAALSRMSARLAVGSEREQVAARLLMNDTQGAAEIAARSRDAAAYRLALQACGEPRATSSVPACAALTTQAWAALNPQDGRPWLRLMAEAMARRDEPAATLALEQALARPSLSPGRPFVLAFAEARGAAGDPEAQGLALVEIIGREAAQWDPSPFGQSRYCSPAAVEDGARRTNCERLARWLLPRADDLLVAMLASGIADRVGIPATQRPYTREQLQRGQQALVEQSTSDLGMDCASLAHVGEVWPARLLQHNELQQALQAASAPR